MTDSSALRNVRIATLIWMGSVFLSRVMGFAREIVIAQQVGANSSTDVYFTAFTLPDFVNYLLAGGALSITFIPIFTRHLARGDEDGAWEVFSVITSFVGVALGILLVLAMTFTEALTPLIAKGFTPAQQQELVYLTRIILPAQFFHFEGFLLSAVQMARGQHKYAATSSLVYNGGTILGGILLGPSLGMEGFCWGVLGGAFAGSFLLQLYGARKVGLRWRFTLQPRHPDLRQYLLLSAPIMIGQSLIVWDEWLTRYFGSFLGAASISWLNYGRKLALVPQAVFAQATGAASFPLLSRQAAEGQVQEVVSTLHASLKGVLLMALATQTFLIAMAPDLCYLLFRSERFGAEDVEATASVLVLFSLGIAAWSAQALIGRAFYAFQDTLTPTAVGTLMTVLFAPVYGLLAKGWQHMGLALASSLGISAYALVLYALFVRKMRHKGHFISFMLLFPFLVRLFAVCGLALALGWFLREGMTPDNGPMSVVSWVRLREGEGLLSGMWVSAVLRCLLLGVILGPFFAFLCLIAGIGEVRELIIKVSTRLLGARRSGRLLERWLPARASEESRRSGRE